MAPIGASGRERTAQMVRIRNEGTNGKQLDAIARAPLWAAGLDFAHGTGHGVGHVLSVHEGPASISRRGEVALEAGMVLSNEPGYYQTGDWGIRIENLIVVILGSLLVHLIDPLVHV